MGVNRIFKRGKKFHIGNKKRLIRKIRKAQKKR